MKKINTGNLGSSSVWLLVMVFAFSIFTRPVMAQLNGWSLSAGASLGFAPNPSYGSDKASTMLLGLQGDLQHDKLIGQFEVSISLPKSVSNSNFISGYGIYGSLGYNVHVTDNFRIPLMLSAGAGIISYNNGINGSAGDTFHDANPQLGFILAPYYRLNRLVSIQAAYRWMKGFPVNSTSQEISQGSISLGIRLTLF